MAKLLPAQLGWGKGEALASSTKSKGEPKNSVFKINSIFMPHFKKSKLVRKIHDKQNIKTLDKDRISITDFPFASSSSKAEQWAYAEGCRVVLGHVRPEGH